MASAKLLLLLLPARLAAAYSGCTDAETSGIQQCESAGSGFFRDQNKAQVCPDSVSTNTSGWSCNDWKCHMYCVNPDNADERKSCDNCDAPAVGESCFASQQGACDAARAASGLVATWTAVARGIRGLRPGSRWRQWAVLRWQPRLDEAWLEQAAGFGRLLEPLAAGWPASRSSERGAGDMSLAGRLPGNFLFSLLAMVTAAAGAVAAAVARVQPGESNQRHEWEVLLHVG
eukprot:CAMPEP_0171096898 /NCGR_PEP_ID=MMETSP0766_2-20121228/46259_1 /TAXON_ID=439317 /ORGANISM="Gambierdiscus australes, Strain CAWD 149" /LENGTH=230 /DNA_ID=CAMNT_0011555981 /DNA_START=37 /DNA_END=726 /DNA_ORIENTATION=+